MPYNTFREMIGMNGSNGTLRIGNGENVIVVAFDGLKPVLYIGENEINTF